MRAALSLQPVVSAGALLVIGCSGGSDSGVVGGAELDALNIASSEVLAEIEIQCGLPDGLLSGAGPAIDYAEIDEVVAGMTCSNEELAKRGFAPVGLIANPVDVDGPAN